MPLILPIFVAMASDWDRILRLAVTGTERHAALRGSAEAPADAAVAALTELARQQLLKKGNPLFPKIAIPPAPEPPLRKPCPDLLQKDLELIVSGIFLPALPEFIQQLQNTGFEWPRASLPAMLGMALRDAKLLPALTELAGPLLPWLAQQHPEWRELFPKTQPEWQTGTLDERCAILRNLRGAEPRKAIELLSAVWAQEPAQSRERFLAELNAGLTKPDTAFLEIAFTDRSRPVRLRAAQLLARLPGSPSFLLWEKISRSANWSVPAILLEKTPDLAAGFDQLLGLQPANDRLSGLERLLSLLPPGIVAAHLGLSPAELLQNWANSRNHERFMPPILEACALHADGTWTDAIVGFFAQKPRHEIWESPAMQRLLDQMPAENWGKTCAALCRHTELLAKPESALVKTLEQSAANWPPELLHALVAGADDLIKGRWIQPGMPYWRQVFGVASYKSRAEVVDMVMRQWLPDPSKPHPFRAEIQQAAAVARFRLRMQAHFKALSE